MRCTAVLGIASAALLVTAGNGRAQSALELSSPDERNVVTVGVVEGTLVYALERDGRKVLLPSRLGFEFRDAPPLFEGLEITGSERHGNDEVWEQPWGEVALVRDLHNELRVSVAETGDPGRQFVVIFRAFDDGIAFRYELPEQPGL
ncbi:MAG: glycoside hydrolase family 97 N-terminal domain-containing protein, partial [Gemmatimonadetes bacterium]|nr:glycoside hydrolase family 97 N-terminal domain-containing protein [Gemmatimonadota bacterium]